MADISNQQADDVARNFHEAYERLAPDHGYETRKDSAVPWEDVPAANKSLMRAVAQAICSRGPDGRVVVNVEASLEKRQK